MSTAILTDSTADIPAFFAEHLPIFQIPAILVINNQEMEDGVDITREDFYRKLPSLDPPPTTAAPSVGSFLNQYQILFESGFTRILSIHAASSLSGIFNAARLAAQEFEDRIHILDSEQLSLGLGFQVIEAAQAALEGQELSDIIERVRDIQKRLRLVALLDTLKYIHRSGRVSWAKARLGALLNIKPFIELVRGEVLQQGSVRSQTKGRQKLLETIHKLGPLEHLAILHTNAAQEAQELLSAYKFSLPNPPFVVNVTTVIGTHVGPGGIGFAAVVK